MEEHRSNGHIPFRDWCKFCIKGRGLEDQHRPSAEESNIPVIGLDYFFVTQLRSQTITIAADNPGTQTADGSGPARAPGQSNELEHRMRVMAHAEAVTQMPDCDVKLRSELDYDNDAAGSAKLQEALRNGEIIKCLIVRCTATKVIFAHCIPYKGAGEDQYVANLVVRAVEWLGHTKLILKADNEPALRTLIEQSLEEIRIKVRGVSQISVEHPPRYDSQSNGGVETGVRFIRWQFRTFKLCLEARICKIVPIKHALVHWMIVQTDSRCRGRQYDGRHNVPS